MPTVRDALTPLKLFLVSFAALALEMAYIRWLPTELRVASYFPNLVLIGSFLGLGAGALLRGRWLPPSGIVIVFSLVVMRIFGGIAFTGSDVGEHFWLLYYDLPAGAPVVHGLVLPLLTVFLLIVFVFMPLGREISARLEHFRSVNRTLPGYCYDLAGSLCGVFVFMILSFAGMRPFTWFLLALAAWCFASSERGWRKGLLVVGSVLGVMLVWKADRADLYSPYYGIRIMDQRPDSHRSVANASNLPTTFSVLTNGSLHQQALDLRKSAVPSAGFPELEKMRTDYRFHFDRLDTPPRRVLVLGAGTGNDIAVLLDAGAPEIHVVEIDPVILDIGRRLHPSAPYADKRVVVHNTDARSYLENTPLKFDLIVFGTLDSMTRLSALSNVRLDNFVYTVESLQAARRCLTERGGVALMFMVGSPAIEEHLFAILHRAFGEPPLVYSGARYLFNRMFLAGPGYSRLSGDRSVHRFDLEQKSERLLAPSDDWPFLYLERVGIPVFYLTLAAVVLAFALLLIGLGNPDMRGDVKDGRIDWEMLGFGAAFLLVETGMVTELNLLFGSLWLTSAVVFAGILCALLLATLARVRWPVSARYSIGLAVLSLAFVALCPVRSLAPGPWLLRLFYAIAVCGVPIFCAGLAFADRYSQRKDAARAFGWNTLGAVLGGLLEFSCMLFGLSAMFLLASVIYLFVLLRVLGEKRPGPLPT